MRTSARPADWRATMRRAMCSASSSTRNASSRTTSSIASSNTSGKRDMWTPFCLGSRSTLQSISEEISFSAPPQRRRIAFSTRCTPARIEDGRYEPSMQAVNTLELARAAAANLGEDRVKVSGEGGEVHVDPEGTERVVSALAQAALRHGGLDEVTLHVDGSTLAVSPVTASSAPVVLGEELRDLGAAVAVRVVRALGGSVALDGDTLTITLPE